MAGISCSGSYALDEVVAAFGGTSVEKDKVGRTKNYLKDSDS